MRRLSFERALPTLLALLATACAPTRPPSPDAGPVSPPPAVAPEASVTAPAGSLGRKVYTVAEVSSLAQRNPRALVNQTVRLRAQLVGGIGGEGCSDVLMLVDPENVATYQKLFDPTATNAEFEHARAVPFLMAGPAKEFPTAVIEMNAGVFGGKFFACDGALRFRIEHADPAETAARRRVP